MELTEYDLKAKKLRKSGYLYVPIPPKLLIPIFIIFSLVLVWRSSLQNVAAMKASIRNFSAP